MAGWVAVSSPPVFQWQASPPQPFWQAKGGAGQHGSN